jgi:hypothetical protein
MNSFPNGIKSSIKYLTSLNTFHLIMEKIKLHDQNQYLAETIKIHRAIEHDLGISLQLEKPNDYPPDLRAGNKPFYVGKYYSFGKPIYPVLVFAPTMKLTAKVYYDALKTGQLKRTDERKLEQIERTVFRTY